MAAGARVERHCDHFKDDEADAAWLRVVGERGWAVVTKDGAIRRNPLERGALEAAGLRAFVLTSGNLAAAQMSEVLVKHLVRMENLARSRRAPFIALVNAAGVRVLDQPPTPPRRRDPHGS